jgi:UPF0755 protein
MMQGGKIKIPSRPFKRLPKNWAQFRALLLSRLVPVSVLAGVLLAVIWTLTAYPPFDFGAPRIVKIPAGATLTSEARALKAAHVIRSETLFQLTAVLLGGERGLIAGSYYFSAPQDVFVVAARMVSGKYDLDPVKVTLPEGVTVEEIASILGDKLAYFDTPTFLALAQGKEGYLFPDTYYFLPTEEPQVVLTALEQNFYKKVQPLRGDIAVSGHTLSDIVIMASLLEEEARTTESRQMISGILWKRISIGMRLQVDAVFPYILGKNTFQVTKADLATDSPYNTYTHAGLPIGPISNPGFDALAAAAHPIASTYLFYLSDKSGTMHYSKTYSQHLRNVNLYLR